jgi:hypothetical protein
MVAAGRFKRAIKKNDPNLSQALDLIPAKGDISREDYLKYTDQFLKAFPNGGGGIATATRLLAMKRPDAFVCLDSASRERMCNAFEISWRLVKQVTKLLSNCDLDSSRNSLANLIHAAIIPSALYEARTWPV